MPVALGVVAGDIDANRDIRLPRLEMVHGVGKLAQQFNAGSLVLGKEDLLAERGKPIYLVILSAFQYWKEWFTTGFVAGGPLPRVFQNSGQVLAAGGTVDWVNGAKPTFSRAMDLKLLIEKPDNVTSQRFGLMFGGKEYAPAIWSVDKMAYKRVGEPVLMASAISLKTRGMLSGRWSLTANVEVKGANTFTMPTLRLVGANNEEFVKEVQAQLGALNTAPVKA